MPDRRSTATNDSVREHDQFLLRLPAGMREHLKSAAGAAGRSLNAEIVHRLQTSIESDAPDEQMAAFEARLDHLTKSVREMSELEAKLGAVSGLLGQLLQKAEKPD